MQMRVLFLGNHSVGVNVINVLHRYGCLVGVIAHPEDPEDGVRYLSVYEHAKKNLDVPVIRATPKCAAFEDFISSLQPDLIWVTDYRYLLPKEIFSKPKLGSINLHPSLLPSYRGRASLNWAMINGEKDVGLTAHFIDEGVDTGDIIKQILLPVKEMDYIEDVLNNMYPLYAQITGDVMELFLKSNVKGSKQVSTVESVFPARKPKDGILSHHQEAKDVLNFIRALSKPYPGAHLYWREKKITIWRAEKTENHFKELGFQKHESKYYLQCLDAALAILEYDVEDYDE